MRGPHNLRIPIGGTCTWHIARQIEGANAGALEYVVWAGPIPSDDGLAPSYIRSDRAGEAMLWLDEGRAAAVAVALNRSPGWKWVARRARP